LIKNNMRSSAVKKIILMLLLGSFSFFPGTSAAQESDAVFGLSLEGIAYSSDGVSMVVINGTMYPEGAVVRGYTVDHIEPDRVTLSKNGKEYTLVLDDEIRTYSKKKQPAPPPAAVPEPARKAPPKKGMFSRIREFKQRLLKRRTAEKKMGIIKSGQE